MNRRETLLGCTAALTAIAGCTSSDDTNDGGSDDTTDGSSDTGGGGSDGGDGSSDGNGDDSTSELQGPTGRENPKYVDIPYREYSDADAERIRGDAEEIEYGTLFRDIESYEGEAVHFEGDIIQALEDEGVFTILVALDNYGEELLYASWTGDRYLKGDRIELWAEVIGTETYEMGTGSQNTVPALTIADIEMAE